MTFNAVIYLDIYARKILIESVLSKCHIKDLAQH